MSVDFTSEHINVIADRDAISRVVTNLMDNAVKFSDPAARLDIKVFTKGGKAYTAVSNEGFGIDPEDLPHVFDRFYKTDKSRNDKRERGSGSIWCRICSQSTARTLSSTASTFPTRSTAATPTIRQNVRRLSFRSSWRRLKN